MRDVWKRKLNNEQVEDVWERNLMLNDAEKEEFKRIVNKFVEQRRCFRPVHPDEVMKEVDRFKRTEDFLEEVESAAVAPRFEL